jgi:hypothetical protein
MMAHKTKESKKKKRKPPAISPPQAVQQERQHPSPQSPEYQVSIPGLDTKGIGPEFYRADWTSYCCTCFFGFVFCVITFSMNIFNPYSYLLHFLFFLYYNALFSLPTTLSASSHPLCPIFTSSSYPFPTVTTHPSLLHTHLPLTSLLYQLYTHPAHCKPWHSPLHCNSGSIPWHT